MTEIITEAPAPVLSDIHRAYLNDNAITDAIIEAQGITSDSGQIVFPWREDDRITLQRRPWPGEAGQYFWVKDRPLHLNLARESDGPEEAVLLCEGTKQHLAVASWAPPQYAVYGMPGCYGWMNSEGRDLSRFAGRHVLIMLDADAADNLDVYEAGARLAVELGMEDAASAEFIPMPAWGKDGIDDYLRKIADSRRPERIVKLAALAQPKPADRKPSHRKISDQVPDTAGRPIVIVNRDRMLVIADILAVMQQRWGGRELFCFGGALARLRGDRAEPLDRDAFAAWLAEGIFTCRYRKPTLTAPGDYDPEWPDQQTMGAVLSLADRFAPLSRIARVPFFRANGTACFKNGYDWDTGTFLACGNSGMDRLDIPDAPSAADAAAAARFLLDEWLGNMPFADQSSRAGALALVLTPFIRGLVPLVPLAVVSGLQPGVGKGLLGDCISIMTTGQVQPPLPYVTDDQDEIRKQITAAFRQGTDLFCFDEAHDLKGAALCRALTSITYTDRILGVSRMAEFPNQVTWMSLGNNVLVDADMSRRVYWIELHPDCPDPQDRPESAFVHPDLRTWTADSRPELVTAALVMIRAWFAAGKPLHPHGLLMGSFEAWDKMMSGILAHAGVTGFLDGLPGKRSEADFTGSWWGDHIAWLHRSFGTAEFTTSDVKTRAQASAGQWDAPPGMDDVMTGGYARELGKAYSKVGPRWFNGLRLVKTGRGHNNTTRWTIQAIGGVSDNETVPDLGGGNQGGITAVDSPVENTGETGEWGESSNPSRTRAGGRAYTRAHTRATGASNPPVSPHSPRFSMCADIETASADDLFTYTQRDETGFVRLAGLIGTSGQPVITSAPQAIEIMNLAAEITGHNFLGFDAIALAWHYPQLVNWEQLAAKVRDTEIIARQWQPPRSRDTHSDDRYDLGTIAGMLGLPGKTDDLRRLARVHGGYDRIPLDDPEYLDYLRGDLLATAAVASRLHHDDYTRREHRLASLAGRMSLNGFMVDQVLLNERLEAGQQRKGQALQVLHDVWGLPLTRTVTRGRGAAKHDVEEPVISPLSTDAGRDWLARMYESYQVPDPPRTGKTRKLALGSDDLARVVSDPRCPADLRSMIALMDLVTGTRTVYQNAAGHLAADGRVHPKISMRQASGRWSTTDPGLTVFGKHEGRHVERDIFTAEPGHVLFSADLEQVDMRGIAGLCQDPAYMALFAPGRDVHSEIAAQVFGEMPRDEKGRHPRRQDAKARGHGWNYGMGPDRMIRDGVDPDMAYGFDNGMRERFPVLCYERERWRAIGAAGEILDNGFGRRMRAEPSRAYTVAPALMGQGSAGDIMKEVLDRLDRAAPELRPYYRVMVHDEQVFSVPEADAPEIIETVREAFTWEWRGVPILCDINGPGPTWGSISAK